jgi:uncharacterized membrane protein YphA (DoxX/SURF4 family)
MYAIVTGFHRFHQALFKHLQCFDGLALLALRLYLVPIFWMAGTKKWQSFDQTVAWFGNSEWGLGLPAPELLAFMATWTEIIGAVLLAAGLAIRWISIPLMITMVVAAVTVHWEHGWYAIASSESQEVAARLGAAKEILKEHGNYGWLTQKGNFVILNNGIEFAATYFIMLLTLLFTGGGRFFSLDYWLARGCRKEG